MEGGGTIDRRSCLVDSPGFGEYVAEHVEDVRMEVDEIERLEKRVRLAKQRFGSGVLALCRQDARERDAPPRLHIQVVLARDRSALVDEGERLLLSSETAHHVGQDGHDGRADSSISDLHHRVAAAPQFGLGASPSSLGEDEAQPISIA